MCAAASLGPCAHGASSFSSSSWPQLTDPDACPGLTAVTADVMPVVRRLTDTVYATQAGGPKDPKRQHKPPSTRHSHGTARPLPDAAPGAWLFPAAGADPWRARRARHHGGAVHGLADPQERRDPPGSAPGWPELGGVPSVQAQGILALDFFAADLLNGTKVYVLGLELVTVATFIECPDLRRFFAGSR